MFVFFSGICDLSSSFRPGTFIRASAILLGPAFSLGPAFAFSYDIMGPLDSFFIVCAINGTIVVCASEVLRLCSSTVGQLPGQCGLSLGPRRR
mmetsp:Transcript_44799/g.113439  ORF Transcript_44799/g.113439 Transcript_44799/m.113439 type:complete len:93 (-) Transcript_44799:612-890(-)